MNCTPIIRLLLLPQCIVFNMCTQRKLQGRWNLVKFGCAITKMMGNISCKEQAFSKLGATSYVAQYFFHQIFNGK